MSIKKILAAAAASVVAVSSMAVVASADGSVTFSDAAWWTENVIIAEDGSNVDALIGDADPADVESVTFTSDTDFVIGYNKADGTWGQPDAGKEFTLTDIALVPVTDANGEEHNPHLKLCLSKGDGVEYTINWTVNLKAGDAAPADENNAPADENNAPAANNVDTGVEGVAAVLGVAAVAAGAMIVAKKRK